MAYRMIIKRGDGKGLVDVEIDSTIVDSMMFLFASLAETEKEPLASQYLEASASLSVETQSQVFLGQDELVDYLTKVQ